MENDMNVVNNGINTNGDAEEIREIKRKPYRIPHLEKLGDLRTLTEFKTRRKSPPFRGSEKAGLSFWL